MPTLTGLTLSAKRERGREGGKEEEQLMFSQFDELIYIDLGMIAKVFII